MKLGVFGATGSIASSLWDVLAHFPQYRISTLVAGTNWQALVELAHRYDAEYVALENTSAQADLAAALPEQCSLVPLDNYETLVGACDRVLVAIPGAASVPIALAAVEAGIDVLLASKEALVVAGEYLMARAKVTGARVIPVDSEHSAAAQCMKGNSDIAALTLTASGGALRDLPASERYNASISDVLAHPNWSMGSKITVDSATLVNKGFELIEAHHLFALEPDQLHAIIHPQSLVHAIVQHHDGSLMWHLSHPDMRLAVAAALAYPHEHSKALSTPPDVATWNQLTFTEIDDGDNPAFKLVCQAMHAGGSAPAVANFANDIAVSQFLSGAIPFGAIANVIDVALNHDIASTPFDIVGLNALSASAGAVVTRHIEQSSYG